MLSRRSAGWIIEAEAAWEAFVDGMRANDRPIAGNRDAGRRGGRFVQPAFGRRQRQTRGPPQFAKSVTDAFFPDAREARRPASTASGAKRGTNGRNGHRSGSAARRASGRRQRVVAMDYGRSDRRRDQGRATQARRVAGQPNAVQRRRLSAARFQFSMLATMFAIDAAYGESVRWQRDAAAERRGSRGQASIARLAPIARIKKPKTRDELEALIRGGGARLAPVATESDWSKVADRRPLMKRLEQAQQQGLTAWTANVTEFVRRRAEAVARSRSSRRWPR